MINRPDHDVVEVEWVLGWGTEDVAVCRHCGAWGFFLGEPCRKVPTASSPATAQRERPIWLPPDSPLLKPE